MQTDCVTYRARVYRMRPHWRSLRVLAVASSAKQSPTCGIRSQKTQTSFLLPAVSYRADGTPRCSKTALSGDQCDEFLASNSKPHEPVFQQVHEFKQAKSSKPATTAWVANSFIADASVQLN
jgi:hypothetical protein